MNDLQILVGKSIKSVSLNDSKTLLKFELENEPPKYFYTEGDCCSYSWIEHMENVDSFPNSIIKEIISIDDVLGLDIENPDAEEQEDGEFIRAYGVSILFEGSKLPVKLEYRNSSNGYYGGAIEEYTSTISNLEASSLNAKAASYYLDAQYSKEEYKDFMEQKALEARQRSKQELDELMFGMKELKEDF